MVQFQNRIFQSLAHSQQKPPHNAPHILFPLLALLISGFRRTIRIPHCISTHNTAYQSHIDFFYRCLRTSIHALYLNHSLIFTSLMHPTPCRLHLSTRKYPLRTHDLPFEHTHPTHRTSRPPAPNQCSATSRPTASVSGGLATVDNHLAPSLEAGLLGLRSSLHHHVYACWVRGREVRRVLGAGG